MRRHAYIRAYIQKCAHRRYIAYCMDAYMHTYVCIVRSVHELILKHSCRWFIIPLLYLYYTCHYYCYYYVSTPKLLLCVGCFLSAWCRGQAGHPNLMTSLPSCNNANQCHMDIKISSVKLDRTGKTRERLPNNGASTTTTDYYYLPTYYLRRPATTIAAIQPR